MAKGGKALLFSLILATSAICVLGMRRLDSQGGTIYIKNNADFHMTFQNKVHYVDGSTVLDPAYNPSPKQRAFGFEVTPDMDSVTTLFQMSTNAAIPRYQWVVEWSLLPGTMKFPCVPDCYWVVDNNGFSVANSLYGQGQFVIGWD